MAPLFSTGSQTRSLQRFCSRPLWPLASTTTFARTSRSRAVLGLDAHADGPVALEQHVEHAHALVRLHAVLAGVVEHHLVELAAHHLPGLRALVRLVVPEVERRRQLAAGVDELHAVLLDEVALLHLVEHVEPLRAPSRSRGSATRRCGSAGSARARTAAPCSPAGRSAWTSSIPAGPPPITTTSGLPDPLPVLVTSSRPPARNAAPSSRSAADPGARPRAPARSAPAPRAAAAPPPRRGRRRP